MSTVDANGYVLAAAQTCPSITMYDLLPAQDPTLLVLFHPYLPKDKRTHAALSKAMAIDRWRRNILTGESQVQCLACTLQAP